MTQPCKALSVFLAIAVYLILCLLGAGFARAAEQEEQGSNSVDVDDSLARARELIGSDQYEAAIDLLPSLLDSLRSDPDRLEQAYLLLIDAYVSYANSHPKDEEVVRDALMKQASVRVREILSDPALRHTQPDSVNCPEEMLTLFVSIRREMFGRVTITVDPPDAEVVLDGVRLQKREEGMWTEENVPVGLRTLQLSHRDRRTLTADLLIAPGEHLVQPYRLDKRRGIGWYATRVALPVAVAGLTWAFVAGGEGSTEEPVLDGSPPGPSSR